MAGFLESSGFKYLKNLIIGVGAAIVMIGALMKITHRPGADLWLTIGLLTEAFIFALQGILPPKKDYYWEKLYPGLDKHAGGVSGKPVDHGDSLTGKLDDMLESAKVEPAMIDRLGANLGKLGDNVEKMSELSEVGAATNQFSEKTREATLALSDMKTAYSRATEAMSLLGDVGADTQKYHVEVQNVSKNLAALNALYEMELQDTNNHLKAMNDFYGNLTHAISAMNDSAQDAEKYRDNMAELNRNLTTLNNVYGNMLAAMSSGRA